MLDTQNGIERKGKTGRSWGRQLHIDWGRERDRGRKIHIQTHRPDTDISLFLPSFFTQSATLDSFLILVRA